MNDQISCARLVSENKGTLKDISRQLEEAVALATQDFTLVHLLYKTNYAGKDMTPEKQIAFSGIGENLQYIDILKQKIEHVMALHERVLEEEAFVMLSGAIFKLNYLQIEAANFEFTNTVENLRATIATLNVPVASALENEGGDSGYFTRAGVISKILKGVGLTLDKIAGRYPMLPISGLALSSIAAYYSMESERFVLRWLMENYDQISRDALVAQYKDFHRDAQIELF